MFRDIAPKPSPGTVRKARTLRRAMTPPEVLLRRELRRRPSGLKFRREHGSGDYILDFYCSDARLAIEVDGTAHDMGDRTARDDKRDAWFASEGIATLRIPATLVLRDLDGAMEAIVGAAQSRLPLHHPAAPDGPPPRDKLGEE